MKVVLPVPFWPSNTRISECEKEPASMCSCPRVSGNANNADNTAACLEAAQRLGHVGVGDGVLLLGLLGALAACGGE